MSYFIDYIKTYANVSRKGRELQIYVQQFERHLIEDENSLKALEHDIECRITAMNEKYPRSRPVRLDVFDDGRVGQWTILVEYDSDSIVCIISYKKVLGCYAANNMNDKDKRQ
ncbi:MAG: hypothetical protein ACLVIA_16805 [Bacteroides eggerthii]